jgi:Fur family ferric uptake transcriptional regulator
MSSARKQAAKHRFLEFAARRKLRLTAPRRAIIDAVFGTEEHFTAEQLLAWARQRDQTVSRATVYRTLPLLTESGLVREMDFGRDQKYYDPNYADHPNHSHIICRDCDKIFEFESEKISRLEDEISRKMGFVLKSQRLEISGNCEELRRLGICKHKDEEEKTVTGKVAPGKPKPACPAAARPRQVNERSFIYLSRRRPGGPPAETAPPAGAASPGPPVSPARRADRQIR